MTASLSDMMFSPEMTVAMLGILGLVIAAIFGLVRWIVQAQPGPDPWGPEVEAAIQGPDAVPVCHHCFTPQEGPNWFCPECGAAVGPYNNLMPYVNAFSEGEVLRVGVNGQWRPNWLMVLGYVLLSVGAYAVAAPIYWFFLLQNLQRLAALPARPEQSSEPE